MRAYANAGLDLLLAVGTEGAARKGHFRVRAFGGVVAYPVIKQRVCAPCAMGCCGPIQARSCAQNLKENGIFER